MIDFFFWMRSKLCHEKNVRTVYCTYMEDSEHFNSAPTHSCWMLGVATQFAHHQKESSHLHTMNQYINHSFKTSVKWELFESAVVVSTVVLAERLYFIDM